jgi:hypothetical protein
MFAFKVRVNNGEPVIGGASDLSVLSAIFTGSGKLGPASVPPRGDDTHDFSFRLGGLTARGEGATDEHLVWLDIEALSVGDAISIEIVETENPHQVISGAQAQQQANDERHYFEHCKRAYLELRHKYEDAA